MKHRFLLDETRKERIREHIMDNEAFDNRDSTSNCPECGQQRSPEYALCTICYYASVLHEGIVVGTVLRYFKEFEGFSIEREYKIQIGTSPCRADVVLCDSEGELAAIAECKKIGYVGESGITQLKDYLRHGGVQFGLFAADTDPSKWTFWRLGNEITRITRSQFEIGVVGKQATRFRRGQAQNPMPLLWRYVAGILGLVLCICVAVLIMQLDDKNTQIQDGSQTVSQLKNVNETLVGENQKLKDDNKTLVSENQTLQGQLTDKNRQIERDTNTISQLKNESKALVSENQTLQKQIQDNTAEKKKTSQDSNVKIEPGPSQENPKSSSQDLLDFLNTADASELDDHLSGIGKTLAKRIVQHRKQNGDFRSVEDVDDVYGIGPGTLKKWKEDFREKQNK